MLDCKLYLTLHQLVSLGGANTPLRTPSRDLRREPSIEAKESAFSPMRKLDDMQAGKILALISICLNYYFVLQWRTKI